jgi:hypothetical protein
MEFYRGRWVHFKDKKEALNKNAVCNTQSQSVESLTASISDSNVLSEASIRQSNYDWTGVESWELDRYLGPV